MSPHIKFTLASLNNEADIIGEFLGSDWAKYVVRRHPELKSAVRIADVVARKRFVAVYLRRYRQQHAKRLTLTVSKFQRIWDARAKKILPLLESIIGTEFPSDRRTLHAYVSVNPICPRFLATWSFTINAYASSASLVRRIVTHEVSHFLHFKKLAELHPGIDPQTFEAPHKTWLLSELAAVAVLNDPRLLSLVGLRERAYAEHCRLKIGRVSAPMVISKIYDQAQRDGRSYDWFLVHAEQEMKKLKN